MPTVAPLRAAGARHWRLRAAQEPREDWRHWPALLWLRRQLHRQLVSGSDCVQSPRTGLLRRSPRRLGQRCVPSCSNCCHAAQRHLAPPLCGQPAAHACAPLACGYWSSFKVSRPAAAQRRHGLTPFCLPAAASFLPLSSRVGNYPWFATFNFLQAKWPKAKEGDTKGKLVRNAAIGAAETSLSPCPASRHVSTQRAAAAAAARRFPAPL